MSIGILASAHVPFVTGGGGYADVVLADSPLAYWRLGESSGTTAADSSGNGNTSTYFNTSVQGATGLVGDADGAVEMTGAGINIKATDAAWMDVDYITVEAVIKPDVVNTFKSIVDRDALAAGYGGTRCWQFRISNTSKLQVVWWSAAGGPYTLTGSTTLVVGNVYHVAWTYDGTNSVLYVNGSSDNTFAQSSTVKTGAADTAIGVNLSTAFGAQPFDGIIDEVAYYGTGLTSARIAAHHAAIT